MDRALFQEKHCATADDLLDELLPHKGGMLWRYHGEDKSWIFRGQFDATWGLTPAAMRHGTLARYVPAQVTAPPRESYQILDRLNAEQSLVMRFAALADRAGFVLPGDSPELRSEATDLTPFNFPPVRYRGLYALAQHYGVPTRLLDWTPRPLVAAYFAAVDAAEDNTTYKKRRWLPQRESENCAIWALSRPALAVALQGRDPTVSIVTAPAAHVPNLAAQAGCFTLVHFSEDEHADVDDPPDLDRLLEGEELREGAELRWAPMLCKFTFPASDAGRLLYLLHLLDVDAASVYPGLAGVERLLFEFTLITPPAHRDED